MNNTFTIGFDITPLDTQLKSKRGIGQSTYRLAKQLLISPSPFNFIFYFLSNSTMESLIPGTDIRNVSHPSGLPALLNKDKIDLIHFNDYFYPLYFPNDFLQGKYRALKSVITAYDVIPFYFENRRPSAEHIKQNLFQILKHVDKIRANSLDTKRELIRLSGIDEKRVEVIYHGLEHTIFHTNYLPSEINNIKSRYNLERDYILQVGAMDWRKNQVTLMKAYKTLLRDENFPLDLVFVGKFQKEHLTFIRNNRLGKRVKLLGIVSDQDLPLIYNAATIFAFPSLYEGFGNPPLEAMACGLPVISSKRGSLPEILGDCPLYLNPRDEISLANAIFALYANPHKRDQMIKKGLKQVKKYSWEKTVSELYQLYLKVLQETTR